MTGAFRLWSCPYLCSPEGNCGVRDCHAVFGNEPRAQTQGSFCPITGQAILTRK
jgi:hypothetical protein